MSVTGYAGMTNLKKLSVEIEPPAELYAGTSAPFTIRVKNGKRRFPSFLLAISCSNSTDSCAKIPMIERSAEATATTYISIPRRGMATLEELRLTSPFPVGFFFRYINFNISRKVLVFPALIPCTPCLPGAGQAKSGERALARRGMDGELERISAYTGTEPLKAIHWKISARSTELMVKGFGTLSAEPLIIDLRELAPHDLEERISCAAWLVRRWVELRPVGLRIGDRVIAAEGGRRQGSRLLTELALVGAVGEIEG